MQLIGMLDSPYVRRVAVSLRLLRIPFDHRALSVFTTFAEFQAVNPVVKAPTLVCDDGTVLMDSTLILEYAEQLAPPGRSLLGSDPAARALELRAIGLALAACEKAVQSVYEQNLRPAEKHHQPWLDRVRGQLHAACVELEAEARKRPTIFWSVPGDITRAGVAAAITWTFTQMMVAGFVQAAEFPALRALAERAEALPEFRDCPPDGPGVPSL